MNQEHLNQPQQYSKRILYAVLGLSPQILTETLYALLKSRESFIPTEIHVLTTTKGAQHCKLALFNENGGWFHRFCQDYDIDGIEFNENHIHTLQNEHGINIDDIRTPEENTAVANQISQHIRSFTSTADSALHVSIAGGRKTMGFYAGYALSMFGREQDRLSHVLVEPQFEGHPNFFYPTPYSSVIRTRDQQEILEVRDAKVDLAYLPIVRMRHAIDEKLIEQAHDFNSMVMYLQRSFEQPNLVVLTKQRSLQVGDRIIKLSPANFVFYYWMLDRLINNKPGIQIPQDGHPDPEYRDEYYAIKNRIIDEMRDMDRTLDSIKNGMTKEFIAQRKTGIKEALTKVLGINAEHYLIQDEKSDRINQHRLMLDPKKIKIT
ncbi:MAG: TIGR02584 family CRISPR-associated protein [Methyloprofundus sp.]|nr:TIGR02584 family CRISPR-associated protein [Methyloprofundus sp.]